MVRDGSAPIPRIVLQNSVRDTYRRAEPTVHTIGQYLLGLWPLVAVVLVAAFLLWSAGNTEPVLGR